MAKQPFYAGGLRFTCKRCSSCCRYESGYVFLSREDLAVLAADQGMGQKEFMKTWCRWVSFDQETEYLSLKEKANYDCIFWRDGCLVYPNRPLQCRTFPFWDSIVSSPELWEKNRLECPGMGEGELHSMARIESYRQARLAQPVVTRERKRAGL
ncbi:MAG: YkgJ family cysteine cluster protein [Treponema sp.]|jgi:Fe-S-cluster containining protein|nr:YkgJ family cysteine cluster protein [Treponema sp.]